MTQPWAALLAITLITAGPSWAGDRLAAPVKGQFTLSVSQAKVGQTFLAELVVDPLSDVPSLRFDIQALKECAKRIDPPVPAKVVEVHKAVPIKVVARFKLVKKGVCDLVAEVVSFEDANTRLGSVYGVRLNPGDAPKPKAPRYGVSASGEKTMEVTADTK